MNGVSNMRYFIQRIRPEDINISFLQMAYNKSFFTHYVALPWICT